MSLEKILHKIQSQINDLAPTLELFIDETIQPSVESCETLQDQLIKLQENIAVYKYKKINNEISPSFNIHAKVSETPVVIEKIPELQTEKTPEPIQEKVQEKIEIADIKTEVVETENKIFSPISIGINDKFRFINELFKQNGSEYGIALEQLNSLKSWNDTEVYLNSLKNLYNWNETNDVVKYFFSIAKKRYN